MYVQNLRVFFCLYSHTPCTTSTTSWWHTEYTVERGKVGEGTLQRVRCVGDRCNDRNLKKRKEGVKYSRGENTKLDFRNKGLPRGQETQRQMFSLRSFSCLQNGVGTLTFSLAKETQRYQKCRTMSTSAPSHISSCSLFHRK